MPRSAVSRSEPGAPPKRSTGISSPNTPRSCRLARVSLTSRTVRVAALDEASGASGDDAQAEGCTGAPGHGQGRQRAHGRPWVTRDDAGEATNRERGPHQQAEDEQRSRCHGQKGRAGADRVTQQVLGEPTYRQSLTGLNVRRRTAWKPTSSTRTRTRSARTIPTTITSHGCARRGSTRTSAARTRPSTGIRTQCDRTQRGRGLGCRQGEPDDCHRQGGEEPAAHQPDAPWDETPSTRVA